MRFSGMALVAAFVLLGACGGGEQKAGSDTSAAAPAATGAAPGTTAGMAATGKTIEVRMVGDEKGYRFEPANFTVMVGDAVKFTVVSGQPHNVAFTNVPAEARAQLQANMPEAMGDLMGKMLLNPNETYTISFAGLKAGTYAYTCTPHIANNMNGTITLQ